MGLPILRGSPYRIMAYKNKEDELEYYKKYYQRNKAKKLAYRKKYYEENKEEILKKNKKKRREQGIGTKKKLSDKELKKRERARNIQWRQKNREKYNTYMREWTRENSDRLNKYKRDYYHNRLTIKVRYSRLKAGANQDNRNRKYKVKITEQEFENIVNQPCYYCGEKEKRRGIDRVDNTKGYIKENSVSCCKTCNYMKRTMSIDNFFNHIKKIYINNQK